MRDANLRNVQMEKNGKNMWPVKIYHEEMLKKVDGRTTGENKQRKKTGYRTTITAQICI